MQPTYLPWLGYFNLIDSVEKFVFLDSVKLEKSDWHVRNRIKTANGEIYLTVPIKNTQGRMHTLISDAEIDPGKPWIKKHLKSIYYAYQKAPYFKEIYPLLEEIFSANFRFLSELNIHFIKSICQQLCIHSEFFIYSELEDICGEKEERLVGICNKVGCREYLSPRGAATYLEKEIPGGQLVKNDILLFYQNFNHPQYFQLYGEFIGHLSIVDLLFNHGMKQSLAVIRSGNGPMIDHLSFRNNIQNLN